MLVGGPAARDLDVLSVDARRKAVLEPLIGHIGPEVLDPVSWHEKSWHTDEYVGDIHWAGTETASDHAGYIEGAIESGLRVAQEVAQALAVTAS
ncbi:FAD-dependent oxidoreductase [Mycolicibacterium boenickei]|uniref:Amine oxidase domain-containing protein n=1 Tax=Mycolicibacterium boenickei TaxID=146017 RepID=A0ABN5ZLL9_9MYCO|nr:FAD-dependent oxidoreductase [Mycolicibacterium boenickei]BBX94027.1 hypothetical protein MBOE_56760 [Mycolicibacterium boenickei]